MRGGRGQFLAQIYLYIHLVDFIDLIPSSNHCGISKEGNFAAFASIASIPSQRRGRKRKILDFRIGQKKRNGGRKEALHKKRY